MPNSWKPRNIWRRFFGRYVLLDPRPMARTAPYTFFLPHPGEVETLRPGDQVKLIFQSLPESTEWDSEKMWVKVTECGTVKLQGMLANRPADMPQLKPGAKVEFEPFHVVDLIRSERDAVSRFDDAHREYWDRCVVDDSILYGGAKVAHVRRETPRHETADAKWVDSGWHIRSTENFRTDDQQGAISESFVALGAVLNKDDSWLQLIDKPIGSSFSRDPSTGEYHECQKAE
jgi:hypothetical protein